VFSLLFALLKIHWCIPKYTRDKQFHATNWQILIVFYFLETLFILLQPLRWCCVDCVIHHERDVCEEQHHTYMWHEQAIIEWSRHVNSIVAYCHSAKLCAYAARDFRSQQYHTISCFRRRFSFCPCQNMFRFTENMMHVHTERTQNFSTKPVATKYPHLSMAKLFGCILKAKKIIFYRAN